MIEAGSEHVDEQRTLSRWQSCARIAPPGFVAIAAAVGMIAVVGAMGGCQAFHLAGAMGQAEEYQKLVDTPPKYDRLQDKSVAVIVQADYATLFEHPSVVATVAANVSRRIAEHVPGSRVLHPTHVIDWQYRTPQWDSMPYGQLAEELNVDRIVHVDVLEYRLNPPGNRWLWEGVAVARVGIIERDAFDPDAFAETFDVSAEFPGMSGVGRESAAAQNIEIGLLKGFVDKTSWLFYQHLEPKYPRQFRPELMTKEQRERMARQ